MRLAPLAVASAVVRDLADGNFREAWPLFDSNFKLCRALAWLYNNRRELGLPDVLDDEVQTLAHRLKELNDIPEGLTDHFVSVEAHQYADLLAGFDDDRWGWSQRRRIVGPRHEMILALPLPTDAPHGILVNRPLLVTSSLKILVSSNPVGNESLYQVAAINCEAAPLPTWPPTWWVIDDPAAIEAHAGVKVTPEVTG